MKTNLKANSGGLPTVVSSPPRTVVLVVAQAGTDLLIAQQLHHHDVEVHLTASHGAMAAALFDDHEESSVAPTILFVLDLRASCGASVIDARLADYDAVLNAYLMSGHPWPNTLCLVESSQAHPLWLQARPHLRATLLADEVETVIGSPQQAHWHESFASALSRCLSS